jgi:hypothetical protein
MAPATRDLSAFHVPLSQHWLSGLLHGTRRFWCWLGSLESDVLREQIDRAEVRRPVYVSGLARAGSTILLEIIASHPDVVSHRYRDFWTIYTPVWWEQVLRRMPPRPNDPRERSHADGLMVTPDSPEAMEEILWMAFFRRLHDPTQSSVLDGRTEHPRFERFYRDHVRKLLLARGGGRYASKANYNLTRLEYLLKLFPGARFVVPVRRPRDHVASLGKQQALLTEAARVHPRSVAYLDRVGHYEFGRHRRPVNAGDDQAIRQILDLWRTGAEVRGWARYWAHLYGYLADRLEANPQLRQAVLVVRYEDLCVDSNQVLRRLFEHCELADAEPVIRRYQASLHPPGYYRPQFTGDEERAIVEETASVAGRYGYEEPRDAGTVVSEHPSTTTIEPVAT